MNVALLCVDRRGSWQSRAWAGAKRGVAHIRCRVPTLRPCWVMGWKVSLPFAEPRDLPKFSKSPAEWVGMR